MAKQPKTGAAPRKLTPTGVMAEYRHPKTDKISRFPMVEIRNGEHGNRGSHRVQLPNGDLIQENEHPHLDFQRYLTSDDENE